MRTLYKKMINKIQGWALYMFGLLENGQVRELITKKDWMIYGKIHRISIKLKFLC